jgi:23S rRNA-/tRNA-specific pseudouridylate synthase
MRAEPGLKHRPDAIRPYIIHRDRHFLAIYKPPGMPTTSFGGGYCLVQEAETLDKDAFFLHPSSRLDADVSGIVLFARTRGANRALLEARGAGQYIRYYLALTQIAPIPPKGSWEAPIAIVTGDKKHRHALTGEASKQTGGKSARTSYQVIAHGLKGVAMQMRPHTGRTHQLRVHASAAGVALLGDRHYQGVSRITLDDGRVLQIRRVMLHCARLQVPNLSDGGSLELNAPVAPDMLELWQALGGDPEKLRVNPEAGEAI